MLSDKIFNWTCWLRYFLFLPRAIYRRTFINGTQYLTQEMYETLCPRGATGEQIASR